MCELSFNSWLFNLLAMLLALWLLKLPTSVSPFLK